MVFLLKENGHLLLRKKQICEHVCTQSMKKQGFYTFSFFKLEFYVLLVWYEIPCGEVLYKNDYIKKVTYVKRIYFLQHVHSSNTVAISQY